VTEKKQLPAGDFSIWLRRIRSALRHSTGSAVPCDGCTACCSSSLFIPVHADETDTKKHIPKKFLFPAPGLQKGTLLLGYFENGCCPMAAKDACVIYDHRPLTCRSFDCRVLAASGVDEYNEDGCAAVFRQARRWTFTYADMLGRKRHSAVREAARFLRAQGASVRGIGAHAHPFRIAVTAVKVYRVFMGCGEDSHRSTHPESFRNTLRRIEHELSFFTD
jgi:Fe-S-cluster containining protein